MARIKHLNYGYFIVERTSIMLLRMYHKKYSLPQDERMQEQQQQKNQRVASSQLGTMSLLRPKSFEDEDRFGMARLWQKSNTAKIS